jgi:hypothetical protein
MALSKIISDSVASNAITSLGVANGAIVTVDLADSSVTGPKLGVYSVSGNNIGIGAITGNLIGVGAITGNNFAQPITGNLIAINSINASNSIVALSVTGNLIGTGAISANNFAGGGITSNVLSSNLSISTVRVAETINVITTSIQGNYNVHIGNTTVYHFLANSAGNTTFNFVANDATSTGTSGRVNDLISVGQSVSVAVLWKQSSTRYRANVYVDGVLQTAYWASNAQPQYSTAASQSMSYDAYNFSIIKIAPNQYTVFASNTNYGQANGLGMGVTVAPFGPGQ